MRDTAPEILERWHAGFDGMSAEDRVKMACSMYEFARELVRTSIKNENPAISERDLSRQVFVRFYGQDFGQEKLDRILVALDCQSLPEETGPGVT